MRVPAAAGTFSQFAYGGSASSSQVGASKSEAIELSSCSDSERKPPKSFMKEKGSQRLNKRRIITSDESDNNASDNDGWLDARNPAKLTSSERMANVMVAKNERKPAAGSSKGTAKPAPKKSRPSLSDDETYEEDEDRVSVVRESFSSSLLEDTPESLSRLEEHRKEAEARKARERSERMNHRRVQKQSARPARRIVIDDSDEESVVSVRSSEEEESDEGESTGNSEDDDNDDDKINDDDDEDIGGDISMGAGWTGTSTKGELHSRTRHIMKVCSNLSKNLRGSLKRWEGRGSDSSSSSSSSSSSGAAADVAVEDTSEGGSNCVNLISIRDDSEVLTSDEIADLCPGLVLKPYQLVGVNWLKLLHKNGINGVLADDMGLGKTVQSIAFIAWLQSLSQSTSSHHRPHFIVVPASTLANWENEFKRFCPSLVVETYHGTQNERAEMRADLRRRFSKGTVDVVLSTFTIFERESSKDDRKFIFNQMFEYMIVDEAHCLKTFSSSRFTNLNNVKSKHRLLLSGTPVQNDLSELLALMSFLMPKVFGREADCESLLESFGWDKKTKATTATKSSGGVSISQLRGMLAPFVLRRLKTDVLDQLTEKTNFLEKVAMPEYQRTVYDNILVAHARRRLRIQQQFQSEKAMHDFLDCKKSAIARSGKESSKESGKDTTIKETIKETVKEAVKAESGKEISIGTGSNKDGVEDKKKDNAPNGSGSDSSGGSSGIVSNAVAVSESQQQQEAISISISFPLDLTASPVEERKCDQGLSSSSSSSSSVAIDLSIENSSSDPVVANAESESSCSNSAPLPSPSAAAVSGTTAAETVDLTSVPETDVAATESIDLTVITTTTASSAVAAADDVAESVVRELSSSEARNLFTALRKAANHPLLLRVRYQNEKAMEHIAQVSYAEGHFGFQCDLQRVRDELSNFSDLDLHQLCVTYPHALGHLELQRENLYDSTKMQKLRVLVPQLAAEGRRMLIFSQWTRLLDILEILMEDLDMSFLRLDGSTPVKERQDLINQFSAPDAAIPVFLLSTKAGGLGINLTAADTVILHDLDFNPENDRQAEDRCHRIGQTKHVRVYKLVATDSVDEDIYEIGERKKRLTSAVLENAASGGAGGAGGKKKGKGASDPADGEEGDIGEIGRILQKALQRSVASMVSEKTIETVASKLNSGTTSTASASANTSAASSSAVSAASTRINKKIILEDDDDDEVLVMC